ncbi:RDD family protein [Metabacillus rhizolycopersici]|uniref:RDD family protein n=1 Tax=Metabacillus rhizolycopersici TaxID=2875709 RepID=A0ABS7UTD3_9BACI|nr:RDD family protein [Metabacillus rhizolycopersici]MBZ5751565.1 RDD family protein [Metabacillus rhizolycopersici]
MNQEQVDIKTPEFVSLQFQSAGLGSRTAAFIIDQLILMTVNVIIIIGLGLVLYGFDDLFYLADEFMSYPIAITLIVLFLLNWGYFFVLEYFSGGKTIGKRVVGIRVIQENGHSLTILSSFIRNLVRIIDSLPANYLVGMLMIFFHPKNKRIGDLVAGTIVVHERKTKKKSRLSAIEKEIERRGLSKDDVEIEEWAFRSLGAKEWNLVKTYSHRLLQLPKDERVQLTNKMAEILLPKIGIEIEGKEASELENALLTLYLFLKEEWEFEL